MNTITIEAGSAKYISQIPAFANGLPHGILNKKQTNVGGTTGCITSSDNYIISVPSVTLIKNKCAQHSNLFGIHEGVKFHDFKQFIENGGNKIMVTYDSTHKVATWLNSMNIDAYTSYKVLVDEYHKLLTDYSYRDSAISSLLQETCKYKHVTYMSATPIDEEYTPELLSELDHYTINWDSTIVKVHRYKTNKPFNAAVNIIKKYKAGNNSLVIGQHVSNEAYFFVNSVTAIKDICDNAGLLPSEVKVVCADNAYNKEILDGYQISTPEAPNKPYTFVTSLAFLGCDFYSKSGVIFIITSTGKKTTLLDISTDIAQIAGRIRNEDNPFKGTIYHIYNTRVADLSPEEFESALNQDIQESHDIINNLNSLTHDQKMAFLKRLKIDDEVSLFYYNSSTCNYMFDDLKVKNLKFRYKVSHLVYSDGISIRKAYMQSGMNVESNQNYEELNDEFLSKAARLSWHELLKGYCEARLADDQDMIAYYGSFEREFEVIYNTLGADKLKALKYEKKNIQEELYSKSNDIKGVILNALTKNYKSGDFIPSAELKAFFADQYTKFKVKKSAKASDIMEYFPQSTESSKRVDGIKTKGYVITYKLILGELVRS